MSPLTDIQQQLKALQSGNILQLDEVPLQEIQPLVQEINRLLLALDKRLSRSREAASNLAHSLKTHLGRLQISSEGTPPGFQNELEALNSQLARLIDRETSRMRIQGQGAREFRTDPLPILNALTESLPKLYPEKPLVVSLDADPKVKIPLDPDDLFELGGILLDNACKWARKQIVVSVVSGRLTIEDDGLPPSADLLNVIGTRGVRADQQTKGSGLGLSMAHDIATLYDAELAYDASPQLGGLRVSLSWASLKTNPS
jgi:signal transduction histidine kinase